MEASARPALPRGVRLHQDKVRNCPVLLGPEVALILDPIGEIVLGEIDGKRSIAEIAAELGQRFDASPDEIAADMREFLEGLAARRLVDLI